MENDSKNLLILCESGICDFSFWVNLNLEHFYKSMDEFIGKTSIPNIFSLGYHQNRFSYEVLNEIKGLDNKFDKYEVPYDSIWLDIDHTDFLFMILKNFQKKGRENYFWVWMEKEEKLWLF